MGRPRRARAVLARGDGREVPPPGSCAALGTPGDRVRRGALRRRQHRDQQRPVPPPPRAPRRRVAARLPDRRVRRGRRSTATPSEIEDELARLARCPARRRASSAVLERGATKLGWRARRVRPRVPLRHRAAAARSRRWRARCIPRAVEAGARVIADCRRHAAPRRDGRGSSARVRAHAARRLRREPLTIRADHVFVCAGAIQTPALLQRSGIRRNIGNGLKMHPTVKIAARFTADRPRRRADAPRHRVRAGPHDRRLGEPARPRGARARRLRRRLRRRARRLGERRRLLRRDPQRRAAAG